MIDVLKFLNSGWRKILLSNQYQRFVNLCKFVYGADIWREVCIIICLILLCWLSGSGFKATKQILCRSKQSVKILLLPPKYEIIMVPSNHSFFKYCDSNIGLFSIAPCKVITLNPLCILFCISSLLLFDGSLSKVIALPTIAIAIVVALSRS